LLRLNDPLLALLLLNSSLLLPLLLLCGSLLLHLSISLLFLDSPLLLLLSTTLLHLLSPNLPLLTATVAITMRIAAAAVPSLRWCLLHLTLRLTPAISSAMRITTTAAVRVSTATAMRITTAVAFTLSKTADRKHDNAQDRENCLVQMPPVHNSCLLWD